MSAPSIGLILAAPRNGPLGLPRAFWLLWLGSLVNSLGGGVFPFLALYLTERRGLTPALAGAAISLYAAGGIASAPVGGALSDRWGRRPMMTSSAFLAAFFMIVLGFARAPWHILACAAAVGFCTHACRPALNAAIADVVPPADRRRAYGLRYWAVNLGFAGAASLAGAVAEANFLLLFIVDAATTAIFGVIVHFGVPEQRPQPDQARQEPQSIAAPLRDRTFVLFMLLQAPVLLVFQQVAVALPLDMQAHGLPLSLVGKLLAINGVAIVFLQPLALRYTAATARTPLLVTASALIGIGFGLSAFMTTAPGYAISILVWTLGEIAFAIVTPALVADLAPEHQRGAYHGLFQLVGATTGVLAPLVGSSVLQEAGSHVLWGGCALLGLAAAALHATVMAKRLRSSTRHAEALDATVVARA